MVIDLDNAPSNNVNELNIKELFFTALRRWYVLLIAMVLFGTASIIYSEKFVTPLYDSTGKLYVVGKESDKITSGEIAISTYLVNDFKDLMADHAILDDVVRSLDYKYTYAQVKNAIKITNPEDSRIIEIQVRTASAEDSKKIVDALCESTQLNLPDIIGIDRINIVRQGSLPKSPSVPNVFSNFLKAMVLAVGVFMVFVAIIYFFNDKINTPDDLEKKLGISVLGDIPYSRTKAKVKN